MPQEDAAWPRVERHRGWVDHRHQTRLIRSKLHPSALEPEILGEGDTEMSNFAKRSLAALLVVASVLLGLTGAEWLVGFVIQVVFNRGPSGSPLLPTVLFALVGLVLFAAGLGLMRGARHLLRP
jgi:hypothetical protein